MENLLKFDREIQAIFAFGGDASPKAPKPKPKDKINVQNVMEKLLEFDRES